MKEKRNKVIRWTDSATLTLTMMFAGIFIWYAESTSKLPVAVSFAALLMILVLPTCGMGVQRDLFRALLSLSDAFWPCCLMMIGFLVFANSTEHLVAGSAMVSYPAAGLYSKSLVRRKSIDDVGRLDYRVNSIAAGGLILALCLTIYIGTKEGILGAIMMLGMALVLQVLMVRIFDKQRGKWVDNNNNEKKRLSDQGTSDANGYCD